ncbi:hypothetical protein ACFTAO_37955 [Paenibacillus rhizoplanae]
MIDDETFELAQEIRLKTWRRKAWRRQE